MKVPSLLPETGQPMPAGAVESRNTDRTALVAMRPAKLLCESGEYVCLIRDVSATGVKLGLFHHLPDISHAFLELANGEIYPMLGVWSAERQASFHFTQPIDQAELIAEPGAFPRRAIRLAVSRPGMAYADGVLRSLKLRDISQNGACFASDTRYALGQTMVLSLDTIPELTAWVRWRRGRNYGVVFDTSLRLDQLAAYALALQPTENADNARRIARVA